MIEIADTDVNKAIENMEKWYDEAMDRVTGWYKRYSQVFALILALLVALVLNADTFQIGKAIYRDQALRSSLVHMAEEALKQPPATGNKSGQEEQPKPAGTSSSGQQGKSGEAKQQTGIASSTTNPPKSETEKGQIVTAVNRSTQTEQETPGSKSEASNPTAADLKKEVEEDVSNLNVTFQRISSLNLPIGWPNGWPDFGLLSLAKILGILLTALMVSLGSNFWFGLLNQLVNIRNAGKKPLTKEEKEAQKA